MFGNCPQRSSHSSRLRRLFGNFPRRSLGTHLNPSQAGRHQGRMPRNSLNRQAQRRNPSHKRRMWKIPWRAGTYPPGNSNKKSTPASLEMPQLRRQCSLKHHRGRSKSQLRNSGNSMPQNWVDKFLAHMSHKTTPQPQIETFRRSNLCRQPNQPLMRTCRISKASTTSPR